MKKALICGISGQDGAYLARFLLSQGYEVWGTSRDAQVSSFANLQRLGIYDRLQLTSMSINDFRSVLQVLTQVRPDEVYSLGGQSSVGLSFEQPIETIESIVTGTVNILEAIRFTGLPIHFYNASSSECFGNTEHAAADEDTPFRPRSPYAVAKAAAHWAVANYRDAYDLYACSGILFNHDSPLRPPRFVTRKVVSAACRIASGEEKKLSLGDLSVIRDWGWAPEYVEVMRLMLQQDRPVDYVICTGQSHSLEAFVEKAFSALGLDWRDHVVHDDSLNRPSEILVGRGNPAKVQRELGWTASVLMQDVVQKMIAAETEEMNGLSPL
jgi:GDPmannose 4,6-dehydratase